MTPIDLQEFAAKLKLEGSPFAEEILIYIDRDAATQDYDEIVIAVEKLVPEKLHKKEIWRQFEHIEERLDTLLAIEDIINGCRERFAMAGIETDKKTDLEDIVAKLADLLPWEWDL